MKQENIGFGGNWSAEWNSVLSTELNLYYSQYNVYAIDYKLETNQQLNQENEVIDTGLKLKSTYILNDHLKLLNGYQFTEVGILNGTEVSKPEFSRTKKDVLLNHAIFNEVEYHDSSLFIRAGIRSNYFQKFEKFLVEPRLNVRYKWSNGFAMKLQGEFKNQSATQIIDFQYDFLGVENRRWTLANEESIPISESKQVSFGVSYNKNDFIIDIEGFYKVVDGITVPNQGFYNNFQFINAIGEYNVKGVELLINKSTNKYGAWLSYTYSINNYKFRTLTPSVFPNNLDIRHSVSLAFNYDIFESLGVSIGGIWRSGQPYTKTIEGNEMVQDGNNTYVNFDSPNSENINDFMRLDASINYNINFKNSKLSAKFGVLNLFDRENDINKYYEVNPNDFNTIIENNNKSLGFTPNLSLRIGF
ncbi:hypothetical protein DFR65_10596 [Oceanihabitans sediminis]|uniref:TonB-dependent receptor n=1 Tax=Oceanihabitans sediminis TaxID=1812012 RepID=A0A368P5Z2_9FLAO|nr:TonB-dependent receptor [Oceanihabitans sediminis]RBP29870.1 hypothetical protein DFR65_10596 [Oceanihabitans sediminis]RCU57209.1 hypothetical protein DU428_09710 [Oceanihabitans sediminis]